MENTAALNQAVDWFRQASPYINAHRGKTFVISLGGDTIAGEGFSALIHDLALMSHLGIRLVLVYGIRAQIAAREAAGQKPSQVVKGLRITDDETLSCVLEVAGSVRARIEAAFSSSLPNTPMSGARLGIVSGNFVTARPYGIHDGVDFGHTGVVRRVHARAINQQLELGNMVLLSPVAYSTTGESFNLHAEEVATEAAIALHADKLIYLTDGPLTVISESSWLRQTTPQEMQARLDANDLDGAPVPVLRNALQACRRGVRRVHFLDRHTDGALIKELFTRDGIGAMLSSDNYEGLRQASIADVGGIIELIAPFEADGTLVRRSREQLEMEIEKFTVIERDGMIVACAALYPMQQFGEIACVVTHPDYRGAGRAEDLLAHLERKAADLGLEKLFVFTTRTRHWFIEQGFTPVPLEALPAERQKSYNYKRNSKALIKPLLR
ncbi:amino-acid N-acetyltransferase [Granulosicoccaceae sp. 1_MG-2023]|nr:amino-acid N-acetyltransferase [Granulosicoccaceae sp. 1_MG-2023]